MKLPTLSEQGRWMLKGAAYAVAVVCIALLLFGAWIVYIRSLHGQMAYEYIQAAIAQQQQAQKPAQLPQVQPSPPPEKP